MSATILPFRRPEEIRDTRAAEPEGPRPSTAHLRTLAVARDKGTEHVARLVCSLPMCWEARLDFFALTDRELALAQRHRRLIRTSSFGEETVQLVLGVNSNEYQDLVKDQAIPLLGTVPPEWAASAWHLKAKWPLAFERIGVLGMVERMPDWREQRRVRLHFRRHGLRSVATG